MVNIKVDFKDYQKRRKDRNFIMIKGLIQWEHNRFEYASNNRASKHMKAKMDRIKERNRQIHNYSLTFLFVTDRKCREKNQLRIWKI